MAKFIYNKYNTNRNYPSTEPTEDYQHFPTVDFRQDLPYNTTYYPSYTFDSVNGFTLTGTPITKAAGQNPVVGYYVLFKATSTSKQDNLMLILSNTFEKSEGEKTYTYHAVYRKQIPLTVTKAELVDTISSAEGIYPNDGVHTNWYWYIKTKLDESSIVVKPNGGETVNGVFTIEWTKSTSDVNVDIELSTNNGSTWDRIASNITGTSFVYDFSLKSASSFCLIRIRPVKGVGGDWDASNGVFSNSNNKAPLAPTNLSPKGIVNKEIINRLSWVHNDEGNQSKFNLKWGTDQVSWNTITQVTTTQYHDIAADTFPLGEIYWQVQTYDDEDIESSWSEVAIFISTITAGNPIVTSPSLVTESRPVFTWSQPDQKEYHVAIGTMEEGLLWEEIKVSNNKSVTCGIDLLSGVNYVLMVRTRDSLGEWSDYYYQNLTVNYIAPPKPIILTTSVNDTVEISIVNPYEGLESRYQFIERNDIYRDGIRIGIIELSYFSKFENINYDDQEAVDAFFVDYTAPKQYIDRSAASGKVYNYHVVAVGYNKAISTSDMETGSASIKWAMLSDLEGNKIELIANPSRTENTDVYVTYNHFAGRNKRVAQYEEYEDVNLVLSYAILKAIDLDKLKSIFKKKETVLYRDNRGRKIYGAISSLSITDDIRDKEWHNVAFSINDVDYIEVV